MSGLCACVGGRVGLGVPWLLLLAVLTFAVKAGSSPSNFFTVDKLGLGFDVLPPLEEIVMVGDRVQIPCRPLSYTQGTPAVSWIFWSNVPSNRKLRQVVQQDERRHILSNGSLLITEVTQEDFTSYKCVLTRSNHSLISGSVRLSKAGTGTWQIKPRNTTSREGSAVRLTCYLASHPPAQHFWLKDAMALPPDDRYYQPSDGVLQITNVSLQDSGGYSCLGINPRLPENFTSPVGYLKVVAARTEDGDSQERQPTLLAVPSSVRAVVGKKAVLECASDAINQPKILWSRIDEQPLRQNGVSRQGQGSLVFTPVQLEDQAVYNCSVVSTSSSTMVPVTNMIELKVLTAPIVQVNMTIQDHFIPLDHSIRNGASVVRISCDAWGQPTPSISWFKDGLPLQDTGRYSLKFIAPSHNHTKQQLAVANVMSMDQGVYQCMAVNSVGVASDGFLLTVSLPPSLPPPPKNVRVVKTTETSIFLSWTAPQYKYSYNVMGWLVAIYEQYDPKSASKEIQLVTNVTSYKIEKLKPYTLYFIYVRTFIIVNVNNLLTGEPSNTIKQRTLADYPSRMPKVYLEALTPNNLQAKWRQLSMEETNGKILRQVVHWRRKHFHYYDQKEISPNVTSYIIKDLQPNKAYQVRVVVGTAAGFPHLSQVPWETIRLPKVQSGLTYTDRLMNTHLTVSSAAPTEILVEWALNTVLCEEMSRFEVRYFTSRPKQLRVQELAPNATAAILVGLEPNTCYTVQVDPKCEDDKLNVAKGGKDKLQDGDKANKTLAWIMCTLPTDITDMDQPVNLGNAFVGVKRVKVRAVNTTSFVVTWRVKRKRGSPDFYTVKVVTLGLAPHGQEGDSGEEKQRRHVGDLGAHPNASIHLLSQEANSPDYERELQDPTAVRYIRVTRRKALLSQLKPLHQYQVTVTAATNVLTSSPSKPTLVTTKEGVPTEPVNLSWTASSTKDAILAWSRPVQLNGFLQSYLVTYSHDQMIWRNHSVRADLTSTKIRNLVSNTNYTIRLAGVTGVGTGEWATIFVYIRATLEADPNISIELVVISVVSLLAALTCVVVVVLCFKILRLRQSSRASFQGNGTSRMVYANGVKSTTATDHSSELEDYKPMLATLPPATQSHHLDTKGGPGKREDDVVTNCSFDPSAMPLNQSDVPHERLEQNHEGHRMLDIFGDDADDASQGLLPSTSPSSRQAVFPRASFSPGESNRGEARLFVSHNASAP